MKVHSPDGRKWRITRRWVPWRRRTKGWIGDALDLGPTGLTHGLGDDPISAIIGAIVLVIMLPFLVIAVLVGLVALAELAVLLAVFPFALLARVCFGTHWYVEIREGFRPYWECEAGDWQASTQRIHDIAAAIARGELPERSLGEAV